MAATAAATPIFNWLKNTIFYERKIYEQKVNEKRKERKRGDGREREMHHRI